MYTEHIGLSFLSSLPLDPARINKAVKMLQRDQLTLFGHVTNDTVYGVVKSQTNHNLIYGCWLRADGTYACHTNNLNTCGGLRNSLCKHIIVVLGQFSYYREIHNILNDWVTESLNRHPQNRNKGNSKYIFTQYMESTGLQLDLSETVESLEFEKVIGNYTYYEPEIIDMNNLEPGWEVADRRTRRNFQEREVPRHLRPQYEFYEYNRLTPRRKKVRDGKVKVIGVNDNFNKNRPLLEVYQSVSDNLSEISNLELKFVLCIADRKREKIATAKTNGWKRCKICDNWICKECFVSFQTQSNLCIGSILGFQPHNTSF